MQTNKSAEPSQSPQSSGAPSQLDQERLETWILVEKRGLVPTLMDISAWCLMRAETAGEASMEWEDTAEMIEDVIPYIARDNEKKGAKPC